MKRLTCFLFLFLIVSSLFYKRDIGDVSGDINYVYENSDEGLYFSTLDSDDEVSQSIEIGKEDVDSFLDYFDAEIISYYYIDDIKVINAYSKYLKKRLPYKNGFYNLQLAISDVVLVGYPQLYQGF